MACNVFGTPVTDATLKGMTEYHDKEIQAPDRARVALQVKNAEGKDTAARNFADSVQAKVSRKGVRCLIYNATGGPLKLVTAFEYSGCISESPFPTILQNGQWGSFVHEKKDDSKVGLVYAATEKPMWQWVLGWFHKNNASSKCYAEIREEGYYSMNSGDDVCKALNTHIEGSKNMHEAVNGDDIIFSSIGNTPFPIYEAVMTLTSAMR